MDLMKIKLFLIKYAVTDVIDSKMNRELIKQELMNQELKFWKIIENEISKKWMMNHHWW